MTDIRATEPMYLCARPALLRTATERIGPIQVGGSSRARRMLIASQAPAVAGPRGDTPFLGTPLANACAIGGVGEATFYGPQAA